MAAAFVAERAPAAPPPGFGRHVLVELLVGTCVLSREGRHVTWAAADPGLGELRAGRHRAVV
ncbi:hypothetical protein [Dactylosporangium salmoneum]|uniref:AraC family transcriptional regulator n=1 Tax=Dactylosporangium salmoneum TaxID=53361 RepID=A0ABN3I8M6_9ACTN